MKKALMQKCNTLFATLFAATALYAADIVEICPCDGEGNTVFTPEYSYDNPAASGLKLYFNIRLIGEYRNNPPAVSADDRSHFDLQYIAFGDREVDAVLNPLKIGVVVSGKTKWAKLIKVQRTPSSVAGVDVAYNLTDLIFEYETEPGDFALPIRLAQDYNGTPCGLDGSGKGPVFQNTNKWNILYTEQPSRGVPVRNADLSALCPASRYLGDPEAWFDGLSAKDLSSINAFRDITLYNLNFWVQTLDIASRMDIASWESPGCWKSVAKGRKASSAVRSSGDAVVANSTVVWVWSVDRKWLDAVMQGNVATWVSPSVEMSGSNAKEIEITYDYDRARSQPKKQKVLASRVEIAGGAIKGDFAFEGKEEGDACLVMSGSPDFLWRSSMGYTLVKDSFVTVPVTCVPAVREVSARAYATEDGEEPTEQFKEFDATTGDATAAYFEIEISEPYAAAIYAFLKPADESTAKCVSGKCVVGSDFSAGIPIYRGATTSTSRGTVYFEDGIESGTTLRFSIVLCTSRKYDETKKVEGFLSNDIAITVENVAPVVNDIRMNGWRLNAEKTAFKGSAMVGIMQTFKFDVWDAELDLDGTDAEAMKIAYTFIDGDTTDAEKECTGNPSTWVIQRKFKTVGTDTCSIEYTITDKDGGKVSGSAYIPVLPKPYVSITGDETAFYEGTYPQFTLALSETPDEDLTVRLTVTPQATGDKRGKLIISGGAPDGNDNYDFTFKAGATPRRAFGVSDSDGTADGASKFVFAAAVTTASIKPGTADTKWCDYYEPGALGPITVQNSDPVLFVNGLRFDDMSMDYNFNSPYSPTPVAVGPGDAILWSVDDVSADLDKGITVTIVDQAGSHSYTATTTDIQTFTPQFKYAGSATVTLTATDKDGGSITVTCYYDVRTPRQPTVADDPDAIVTGDAESGYTVQPSAERTSVEVTIPAGVEAAKVTVEVGADVETVKPNGATLKVVKGDDDITPYLDIPPSDASGTVDLTQATVKEAVVKEALDPAKGAEISLSVESPSITTSETKPGLTYAFSEGTTLEGLAPKASKLGDGKPWSPTITVKGGTSGFYSIGVKK